jgi:hypothetical protein
VSVATTSIVFLLVVSSLGQSSGPPSHGEVMNPEEILVSTIALRDLMANRNPDRIFLRDTTQTRGSATDPFIAAFLRDAPDDLKADFDSRNKRPVVTITPGTIQFPAELKLLSQEEELKLVQEGRGCQPEAPIAFFSRRGLDSMRDTALIYVGSVCYDREYSSFLLLKRNRGEWVVSSHLVESDTIIDHFPPSKAAPSKAVEPNRERSAEGRR